MTEMKLSFDLQMQGAEQVSRTLRGLAQDLNTMPRGAKEGVEALNANINSILKSLSSLNNASSGLQGLDKSLEKAFGSAQANLIRNLKNEVEGLEKQFDRLSQKTEDYSRAAKKARERGLEGAATGAEGLAAESAMQALAARGAVSAARQNLNDIMNPAPPPGAIQKLMLGPAGELPGMNQLASVFGFGGMAGLARFGLIGGGLMMAPSLIHMAGTGGLRQDISQRGYAIRGDEESLAGDPTRNLIRALGLGSDTALGDNSFSMQKIANVISLGGRSMAGLVMGRTPGQTATDFAAELSDLDKAKFADLSRIAGMRTRIGERLNPAERNFGIAGVRGDLSGLIGGGVDEELGFETVEMLSRYGGRAGAGSRDLALSGTRFGLTRGMRQGAAQRMVRGTGDIGGALDVMGVAGAGTQESQQVVSQFLESRLALDPTGAEGLGQLGVGFAGASRGIGAALPGISDVDRVGLAASQTGVMESRLRTPFDPMRTLTKSVLISQGLSPTEAEFFILRGVDRSTNDINKLLAGRGKKGADIGKSLSQTVGNLPRAIAGLYNEGTGSDFQDMFGDAGLQIAYGTRTGEEATARQAATEGFFSGVDISGGRALATPGQQTTQDTQREQRATVDKTLITELQKLSTVLELATKTGSGEIVKQIQMATGAVTDALDKTGAGNLVVRPFPGPSKPPKAGVDR